MQILGVDLMNLLVISGIAVAWIAVAAIVVSLRPSARIRELAKENELLRHENEVLKQHLAEYIGRVEALEKIKQALEIEKQSLYSKVRDLENKLRLLAQDNRQALNLWKAYRDGVVKIVSPEDGSECRVLSDGVIVCGDRVEYPKG